MLRHYERFVDVIFSNLCRSIFVLLEQEHARKRLAALSLPALLKRCRTTMVQYVADEALRGNLPLPRCVNLLSGTHFSKLYSPI